MRMKRRSCLPNSRSRRNGARAMVGLKNKKKKAEINANHKEEAMPLPYLPEHLVVRILSKLPVKSLLQFKCVSKPWRSLISDPCFIKTHLSQSVTKSVLIATTHPTFRLYTISFGSAGNDIVEAKVEFLFQNIKPHPRCEIIGSCNGLIAMGVEFDDIYHKGDWGVSIYVFNLSTRESKEIPDCDSRGVLFGFGYDQCSDDYILASTCSDSIYVYSLKIGSWRKVHDFPDYFLHVPNGTMLNGALHWFRFRINNNLDKTFEIAALSLADEKLWKIPLPTSLTKFQLGTCHMGLFEGCLCVLSGCGDEIWVMKEYGVKQSWAKLDIKVPFSHKLEPLGLLRNDEALLLIDYTKLVLYNKREGTCKDLVIHGVEKKKEFHATIHVDSLLSPFMKI